MTYGLTNLTTSNAFPCKVAILDIYEKKHIIDFNFIKTSPYLHFSSTNSSLINTLLLSIKHDMGKMSISP
jgi:hypothetical protein